MNKRLIEKIYDDYAGTDEYVDSPEIQASRKKSREYSEYETEVFLQHLPEAERDVMSEAIAELADEGEKTGFVLGFRYGAKLMAEIYNTEESE